MLSIDKRLTKEQVPRKFRFQKMDGKLFYKKICHLFKNRKKTLDSCMEQLLKAIHQSIIVNIPKIRKSRKEEPWRDQEYQVVVVKLKNLYQINSLEISYQIENPM